MLTGTTSLVASSSSAFPRGPLNPMIAQTAASGGQTSSAQSDSGSAIDTAIDDLTRNMMVLRSHRGTLVEIAKKKPFSV